VDQRDQPHLDADALGAVAASLLRVPARPGWPEPPFLLALPWGDPWRIDDLGFDLEARPLVDADDALQVLCRQQARPEWVAVGVVVEGWTVPPSAADDVDWRTLHRNGPSLRRHPQRRRVRTLHLVGRGGPVALALLSDGDVEPQVHASPDGGADGGPTGPLPDGLRRLLGLPTPGCGVSALELWASLWLAAVVARASRAPLDWAGVAALHPGSRLLERAGPPDLAPDLVVVGRALARAWGWVALQRAAINGAEQASFLPPADVAAFADAGMFARLVLRQVEPLWSSRRSLEGQLQASVLARIDATLQAWCLDPTPPGHRAAVASCERRPDHAA